MKRQTVAKDIYQSLKMWTLLSPRLGRNTSSHCLQKEDSHAYQRLPLEVVKREGLISSPSLLILMATQRIGLAVASHWSRRCSIVY
jgi:hypothetical protein